MLSVTGHLGQARREEPYSPARGQSLGPMETDVPKATRMLFEVVLVLPIFDSYPRILLSPNDPVPNNDFIVELT